MKNKWGLMAALAVLLSSPAAALTQPLLINFQGKLVNPTTNNPTTGTVGLILSLYTAASGGTNIWTETQSGVAVTNGVFSVQIGAVTPLPREVFLGPNLYLGVQVSGDAAGEMTPRQRLIMSPYAFTANQLSDAGNVHLVADTVYSTFTNAGNLTIPGGLVGSSASFVNGVNASSATFTQYVAASSATFTATGSSAYALTVSSGLVVQQGTLDVNGGGGIANTYGIASATGIFTSSVTAGFFVGNGVNVSSVPGTFFNLRIFTAGTSYVPSPTNISSITIEMWGGGGAGGSCTAVAGCAAGGGGSGGYARYTLAPVNAAGYTIAIGTAGAAVPGGNGQGGGPTTFNTGSIVITAYGGVGGTTHPGTAAINISTGGAGAPVSLNGEVNGGGAPGGFGITSTVVTEGVTGAGGSTALGGGGGSVGYHTAVAAPGLPAVASTGSGGSGGGTGTLTAAAGGAGAAGLIIITEYH